MKILNLFEILKFVENLYEIWTLKKINFRIFKFVENF
jgi:hypothetical protein